MYQHMFGVRVHVYRCIGAVYEREGGRERERELRERGERGREREGGGERREGERGRERRQGQREEWKVERREN